MTYVCLQWYTIHSFIIQRVLSLNNGNTLASCAPVARVQLPDPAISTCHFFRGLWNVMQSQARAVAHGNVIYAL